MGNGSERYAVTPRILILGGTREARLLAERLVADDLAVPVTSLAGATDSPGALPGEVRVGGFGGVSGLTAHLWQEGYAAVVDATHPFAARITANAAAACEATAVPRLTLLRPVWEPALGEHWVDVADETAAAQALRSVRVSANQRVFLALGRQRVGPFAKIAWVNFLLRTTDPIDQPFEGCEVIVGRGPFSLEAEEALFRRERVVALVCRNSGGEGDAKLEAARAVKATIVMIRRPVLITQSEGANATGGATALDVDAALSWIVECLRRR